MTRIAAINYDTLPYAEERARDLFADWGYGNIPPIRTGDYSDRAMPNLFGQPRVTLLAITDKNKAKHQLESLVTGLSSKTPDAGDAMVILLSQPENLKPVKALKALCDRNGWTYENPRKDAHGELNVIIGKVNLNPDTKAKLLDYVGEDYEALLPIVKGLAHVPKEEQARLDFDALLMRIPQAPGAVVPWGQGYGKDRIPGIDDYLADHDLGGALTKLDRVLAGSTHPLVILATIKNRFQPMYRMKALLASGCDWSQAAGILELPDPKYSGKGQKDPKYKKSGYPTKLLINECNRYSMRRLTEISRAIVETESIIKGQNLGTKLPDDVSLARLCAIITDGWR